MKKSVAPQSKRSFIERRSGRDRRRLYDVYYFKDGQTMTGRHKERRAESERRAGWRRVSKWGSVPLRDQNR